MSDYIDTREKLPLPINPLFYIKILFVLLVWLTISKSKRKTIKETIYGFIPHKCKWEGKDILYPLVGSPAESCHYYRCKYFGCNFVASKEFTEKEDTK